MAVVKDFMTPGAKSRFEDEETNQANLGHEHIWQVVVLNRDKTLVSIVAVDDLIEKRAGSHDQLARLTHDIHFRGQRDLSE